MRELVITAKATFRENPLTTTPKAVPAAGGCSVSVTTIIKIERPTAREYKVIENRNECEGIRENREPEMRPTICPPITFLGLAVMLFGIAKTMKDVAPIDAITTACSILKSRSTMNIVRVARRL